ncbi:UDP-diphosphatase [candidate division BRC1 bacterium HGW-BRC1-1]|nr:MAG: UDP-diphosphatase [candidate division BRC1 bacterium HGW-BRC1-1]
MVTISQAIALGIAQGATEFLPISSSAHLVLIPWLLKWETPDNIMSFDVALHLGTLFAVLIYFFFDWLMIVASYIGDLRMKKWKGGARGSLLPKIILGCIPGAVVGWLLEERVEALFYNDPRSIWMLAVTLSVFGLALLISERVGKQKYEETQMSYKHALLIGCAQAFAIVPGVSRSGVTIFAGLMLSLTRPAAARFSFLLGTPIIAGAAILKIGELHASDFNASLFLGVLSAAITGILAIKLLLTWVQNRSYGIFVYYRWLLAVVVLVVYYLRATAIA